jgi:hypothetical protein
MGQWRGKYLDTGPPRGPGHSSKDGRWWWDDGQDRWFRVTGQEDVLEVEAEDVGGISLVASLVTTPGQLVDEGWRPAGHGAHWWSAIFTRRHMPTTPTPA